MLDLAAQPRRFLHCLQHKSRLSLVTGKHAASCTPGGNSGGHPLRRGISRVLQAWMVPRLAAGSNLFCPVLCLENLQPENVTAVDHAGQPFPHTGSPCFPVEYSRRISPAGLDSPPAGGCMILSGCASWMV